MGGGLLIAGTTSDAGKSTVAAGLCRWLARRGVRVAPFKAQNMSNNSMVCPDGAEIGRAQWLQAVAAGAVPESAMNPVLLKPGGDRRSHVVLHGEPWGELRAGEWATGRAALAEAAHAALADLRRRYDVVICEGAGSPAEINLRDGDYVNLGLARQAGLPVVVVGDIDRGGLLAALAGTVAVLDKDDQAHVAAFLVNKFRGDAGLLAPGLRTLTELTGRPVLGVLPWLPDVWLDSEDALAIAGWDGHRRGAGATLRVAAVRLPRVSNATDLDPLAAEPGVAVTVTADPDVVASADLAVLPGTRSTVEDLAWLRERGIADAIARRAETGRPVLGVCGGYQMLARTIHDDVESGAGAVPGLGLLPLTVRFSATKSLGTPAGSWRGHPVTGYEIHHGVAELDTGAEPFLDGTRRGAVWATMWHGVFEHDAFRRSWLTEVARQAGVAWEPADAPGFTARREAMLDGLADAVESHVDTAALLALIEGGVPPGLPWVRLGQDSA
ncbi:cobyric acid synthase [Prauserella muralis]|uniref:Cobyric acid synthase n=1 Tax=Prauserella muralis TaxID=588067 RepID=A0A2V4B1C0_9PSEU|nr:cobyric acid synthase [Prauserella muralis]PXY27178.1 cobyric acid synthase CobQ [Prauserella muralis]TWE23170.1 adenosylcobyric acid synthase (glutamine-hydrolysing) [Prauserella muralis]